MKEMTEQQIESKNKHIVIAIDGQAATGKSSSAADIAKTYNLKHFNTGMVYRGITCYLIDLNNQMSQHLFAWSECQNSKSAEAVLKFVASHMQVSVEYHEDGQHIIVNGQDYTPHTGQEDVSSLVPKISPFPFIREKVVKIQRETAAKNDIVMEGRDIGSFVLKDMADIKLFFTASQEVRAQRSYERYLSLGQDVKFESVLNEVIQRDKADQERECGKMLLANDAIRIDTSDMNKESVSRYVKLILETQIPKLKSRKNEKSKTVEKIKIK